MFATQCQEAQLEIVIMLENHILESEHYIQTLQTHIIFLECQRKINSTETQTLQLMQTN